jgi:hypothetical protein
MASNLSPEHRAKAGFRAGVDEGFALTLLFGYAMLSG